MNYKFDFSDDVKNLEGIFQLSVKGVNDNLQIETITFHILTKGAKRFINYNLENNFQIVSAPFSDQFPPDSSFVCNARQTYDLEVKSNSLKCSSKLSIYYIKFSLTQSFSDSGNILF